MRDLDKEDVPALGKKIVKEQAPPEPKRVTDGVFKDADGRFRTIIPGNEAANKPDPPQTIWEFFNHQGVIQP